MAFPNTVWRVDELKSKFLPDDLHHLWNILSRNPDKTVKMQSIITDLKMIEGLFPRDIKNISWFASIILDDETPIFEIFENSSDNIYHSRYKFLAYCYLKYGLDGIQIRKKISCNICNQHKEYIKDTEELFEPCYRKNYEHCIKFECLPGYSVMHCCKCGAFKKFSPDSTNTIDTLGVCIVTSNTHVIVYKRELFCPYENI